MNNNILSSEILLNKNYNIIRLDREIRCGGLVIFLYKYLKYKLVDFPNPHSLEILCIDLLFDNNPKVRFILVYRPPNLISNLTKEIFNILKSLIT